MCPENLPQFLMAALADEVEIDLPEGWEESIGVVGLDDCAGVLDLDRVVGDHRRLDDPAPDTAVLMLQGHRAFGCDDRNAIGEGSQDPHGHGAVVDVWAKDPVRLVVGAVDEVTEVNLGYRRGGAHWGSAHVIHGAHALSTGYMDDVGNLLKGT